jgi:hypothetical protein
MLVYTLRFNYKSGCSETFKMSKFTVENGNYSWTPYGDCKPLLLGVEHIESIAQLGVEDIPALPPLEV